MFNKAVLMISRDSSLIMAVQQKMSAIRGLQLRIVEKLGEVGTSIEQEGFGLIVVHLDGRRDYEKVARVLRMSSTLLRPIPVLAVSEHYQGQKALAMFRMGVADYVSRADHLDKLASLIDVLTLGAGRNEPRPVETIARGAGSRRRRLLSSPHS